MVEAEKIIIRPIISEKSYRQIDEHRYTFEVHPDAHKTVVAQAVEQLFGVTVVDVSTAHVPSKPKRRGATRGRSRSWKKAVVTLAPADKIEFFEGR
jgi:large subunit ribosomal protein L23